RTRRLCRHRTVDGRSSRASAQRPIPRRWCESARRDFRCRSAVDGTRTGPCHFRSRDAFDSSHTHWKEYEMNQNDKPVHFAALHVKGAPLLLYNAWDAGSAKAIVDAGAKAIATSSWAVAEAQGYRDGEAIPVGLVEQIVARIAGTIEVPVTVDFEGGYSDDDNALAENVSRILDLGVIGINFEDRVVKGVGLYAVDRQARRIAALRDAADKKGINLFIIARTDLFLGQKGDPAQSVGDALDRAK